MTRFESLAGVREKMKEVLKSMKFIKGRRCYNCVHYSYDENNNWHDMCGYSRDNSISECDPYEAETCSGYKYSERDLRV